MQYRSQNIFKRLYSYTTNNNLKQFQRLKLQSEYDQQGIQNTLKKDRKHKGQKSNWTRSEKEEFRPVTLHIKLCRKNWRQALDILEEVKHKYEHHEIPTGVYNATMSICKNSGQTELVEELFSEILEPDIISYNIIISANAKIGILLMCKLSLASTVIPSSTS